MRRRPSDSGDLSSRNLRKALRRFSCSSLKAKFTAAIPLGRLDTLDATTNGRNLLDRLVKALSGPATTVHHGPRKVAAAVGCAAMAATTLHVDDPRAEIHKLVVGPMDNNVF